jgi:hypothetical protein
MKRAVLAMFFEGKGPLSNGTEEESRGLKMGKPREKCFRRLVTSGNKICTFMYPKEKF